MRRAGLALALVLVAASAFAAGRAYDRAQWPHWSSVPGQCWDVRQEVLRRDSLDAVTWDLASGACRITAGLWIDPYSLRPAWVRTPATVQVDHTIALETASAWGGAAWPRDRKADYANDLRFRFALQATDAALNQSKGARPPSRWTPAPAAHCDYGRNVATLIVIWGLEPPEPERRAIRELVSAC